ncbi:BMY1 [Symbiodinium sp. CCMP2592]|nr:BMY1 [Symbiodinium sp. CCMP2592]
MNPMASAILAAIPCPNGSSTSETPRRMSEAATPCLGSVCSLKPQQWRPGSYFMVCAVHAIVTASLFPTAYELRNDDFIFRGSCGLLDKCLFCVMMLASFLAGCMAAFLIKRVDASGHARSACGYAVVNWAQSLVASWNLQNKSCSPTFDRENGQHFTHRLEDSFLEWWLPTVLYGRLVLYLFCLFWMQMLIASRLESLERSSNRKYNSACFRKLVGMQVFGFMLSAVAFVVLLAAQQGHELSDIVRDEWATCAYRAAFVTTAMTWLFNLVASMVAIFSLARSFLDLKRVARVAETTDTAMVVILSLRRARRFAALQATGVSISLFLTILAVPAIELGLHRQPHPAPSPVGDPSLEVLAAGDNQIQVVLVWVSLVIQACDFLGNSAAALLLSGSHRLPVDSRTSQNTTCQRCLPRAAPSIEKAWDPAWKAKVEELSLRGMTLRSLFHFYEAELRSMPDWTYAPKEHKTRDVVRRVIIPLTSSQESSYVVSVLNRDGARNAEVMVTHNWGNCFKDLLAAVVSDALNECSFTLAAKLLEDDWQFLFEILRQSGRLDVTYWICAFAVNQHICICHSNPCDRDPFTDELHPVCNCGSVNIFDPDGTSIASEINKFDDMMYHLATTGGCRQVIAVDQAFDLFTRAWCVAEIAEAKRLQMNQTLKLSSRAAIMQRARSLENLDVQSMRATSEADKQLILSKIQRTTSINKFNTELQSLVLDQRSGLLASWHAMDSVQQVGEVGRLIRWGLADAGTGKVWKAWEAHE